MGWTDSGKNIDSSWISVHLDPPPVLPLKFNFPLMEYI